MQYEKMLTKGSISAIMNHEEIKDPVIQILGIRKIITGAVGTNEKYHLLISDGQTSSYYVMIPTQFNDNIIYSSKLTKFSIVRIKSHVTKNLSSNFKYKKRVFIILDLEVLIHGSSVGLKLGNPKLIINNSVVRNNSSALVDISRLQSNFMISYSGQSNAICNVHKIDIDFNNTNFVDSYDLCQNFDNLQLSTEMEYEQMLTGSWKSIMNNGAINSLKMQVLNIEMIINCWGKKRYRLLLSDGYNSYSYVMLASKLNNMVLNGRVGKFAIVWITDHKIGDLCRSETSIKVMIIVGLDVLVSGSQVNLKIGDPKPIINYEFETLDSSAIHLNCVLSKHFDIFPFP